MDLIVLGVGALLISLIVVAFKQAANHRKRNSPSNDIKLQRLNVMQLGPFSGHSNFYNRKKLNVFVSLALFSFSAYAEDIKTLHNWNIQDFGDESLIVFKERNDSDQDTSGHNITVDYCGDSVKNGPETCDGIDLDGETCESQEYSSGNLSCVVDCGSFNTSNCV